MNENSAYMSLSEHLYNDILKNILNGKINPGQKLVEDAFQKKYNVSKSPVRESFQMLINSGFVIRETRRGCFVKNLDPKEVEHIYKIRMVLEGFAAKEAYQNINKSDLQLLDKLYAKMKNDADADDAISYFNHHNEFQGLFGKVSENPLLYDICEKLRFQNMWYHMQFFNVDLNEDLHTHDELLEHFINHDVKPEKIEKLMYKHVEIGLINFMKFLAENNCNSTND